VVERLQVRLGQLPVIVNTATAPGCLLAFFVLIGAVGLVEPLDAAGAMVDADVFSVAPPAVAPAEPDVLEVSDVPVVGAMVPLDADDVAGAGPVEAAAGAELLDAPAVPVAPVVPDVPDAADVDGALVADEAPEDELVDVDPDAEVDAAEEFVTPAPIVAERPASPRMRYIRLSGSTCSGSGSEDSDDTALPCRAAEGVAPGDPPAPVDDVDCAEVAAAGEAVGAAESVDAAPDEATLAELWAGTGARATIR
jgi:hypothetical protein